MTNPPAIHIQNLVKRYGRQAVVDGLSLTVADGSRAVLLGPNGAGKSTTMEIVSTLRTPTSGQVTVYGHDVVREATEVRRVLGLTPQSNTLDPLMTPTEVLALQGVTLGHTTPAARRRAGDLIDLFALREYAGKRLGQLSGGTRRRVDLALALVGSPSLIVLDEPTTGLDPLSRLDLWDELRRLNREAGTTLFISTQDLHEAEVLATELLILRAGRLVADGTPEGLKQRVGGRTLAVTLADPDRISTVAAHLRSAYTLDPEAPAEIRIALADDPTAPAAWPAVIEELGAFAPDITALRLDEPTLDDVFANLARTTQETTA